MSDKQRLRDKLAKLQQGIGAGDTGGRRLDAENKDGLLSAILQEIDETVLGRLLTLENSKGATIGMEVASRRIMRFIKLPPEDKPGEEAGMVDQAIDTIDGPEAVTFLALLVDLIGEETSLLVRSTKINRTVNPTEIGCSPDALANLWMLGGLYSSEQDGNDQKRLEFIGYCKSVSVCWLQNQTDGKTHKSDEKSETDALLPLIEGRLPESEVLAGTNCVVFGDAITDENLILAMFSDAERFVCLLQKAAYTDAIAKWHQSAEGDPL